MKVEPAAALVGDVAVPGVKGICQRGVLLGAVADGESELRGFGHAADTDAAIDVVRALGAEVEEPSEDVVRVRGLGLRGLREPSAALDCARNRPRTGSAPSTMFSITLRCGASDSS